MKKIIFYILLLIVGTSNAQSITVRQLILLNKLSTADVDYCMNKINCELISSDDSSGSTLLTYNSRNAAEKENYLYKINRSDKVNIFLYISYKSADTEKMIDEIYNLGFKLVKIYDDPGSLGKLYKLDTVFVTVEETYNGSAENFISFTITELLKK
jgi:hypothetical protein